jgi:uncharacterized protein (TIGR00251 family)
MVRPDPPPFTIRPEGLALWVRLTPKANRDTIEGVAVAGDGRRRLTAKVRAVPADGKANAALVRLIAGWLGVPRGEVSVAGGAASRSKTVLVRGDGPALARRIRSLLDAAPTP